MTYQRVHKPTKQVWKANRQKQNKNPKMRDALKPRKKDGTLRNDYSGY